MKKPIRVIVCGGRRYTDFETACIKLDNILVNHPKEDIEIVSGCCDRGTVTFTRPDGTKVYGADGLGERYAHERGIGVKYFPPDWTTFDKKAGPLRNTDMSKYGTHCVAFYDGWSKGTKDMIDKAQKAKLPTRIINYKQ
jgi:hypothetical protein